MGRKPRIQFEGGVYHVETIYKNILVAFEYDKGWLNDSFSSSPFSLPLE